MLKKKFVFGTGALLLAVGAQAAVITPTSVVGTSEWANDGLGDGALVHLVDDSGLTGVGIAAVHDNSGIAATMWHGGPNDAGIAGGEGNPPVVADQAVVFDLGALYDLTNTYVWQMNQAALTGRGVATMDILVSADGTTFTTVVGGSTGLAEGSGLAGETVQTIATAASSVRYIQFDIQTAHSGLGSDYVGLSEVKFEGTLVPEPGSLALLGLGGLLIARRRRA